MSHQVRWRSGGHQLSRADRVDVLRFEVADVNTVIKGSARVSEYHDELVTASVLPSGEQVLPLSCFAVTERWTPARLAQSTRYASYRQASAAALTSAASAVWPTSVFIDGVGDPRNEVHYDVIVAHDVDLGLATLFQGTPAERAATRGRLRPSFERLLGLLGDPRQLEECACRCHGIADVARQLLTRGRGS